MDFYGSGGDIFDEWMIVVEDLLVLLSEVREDIIAGGSPDLSDVDDVAASENLLYARLSDVDSVLDVHDDVMGEYQRVRRCVVDGEGFDGVVLDQVLYRKDLVAEIIGILADQHRFSEIVAVACIDMGKPVLPQLTFDLDSLDC